jgi:hypothetical protein
MPHFRSKPVVIEAVRLTKPSVISTLEGDMQANPADWLIQGTAGELYPCRDDIFRTKYEPIDAAGVKMLIERFDDDEPIIIPFPNLDQLNQELAAIEAADEANDSSTDD